MKYYSRAKVAEKFKKYVRANFEYAVDAAEHYGVSSAYISRVSKARVVPNESMLNDLGLERINLFIKSKG